MPNYKLELSNDTEKKPTNNKPLPEASAFEKTGNMVALPSQSDFDKVFNLVSKNYFSALKLLEDSADKIGAGLTSNPYNDEVTVHSVFFQPKYMFNVQLLINFIKALRNDLTVARQTKESYIARLKNLISSLQFTLNPQFTKEIKLLERTLDPIETFYENSPLAKKRLIAAFDDAAELPTSTLNM